MSALPWLTKETKTAPTGSFTGVSFGKYFINGKIVDEATYRAAMAAKKGPDKPDNAPKPYMYDGHDAKGDRMSGRVMATSPEDAKKQVAARGVKPKFMFQSGVANPPNLAEDAQAQSPSQATKPKPKPNAPPPLPAKGKEPPPLPKQGQSAQPATGDASKIEARVQEGHKPQHGSQDPSWKRVADQRQAEVTAQEQRAHELRKRVPPLPAGRSSAQPPPLPSKNGQPPSLPHHRTQQSATDAANAVSQAAKAGDPAKLQSAHSEARRVIGEHFREGMKAIDRIAAQKHGNTPKAKQVALATKRAFKAKLQKALQRLEAMAKGQVTKGLDEGWDFGLELVDDGLPWVVKDWTPEDERRHPRGQHGRFAAHATSGGGPEFRNFESPKLDDGDTDSVNASHAKAVHAARQKLGDALSAKIARAKPGEGGETHLSVQEVDHLLAHGVIGLISSGRNPNHPEDKELDDTAVSARHDKLRSELVEAGFRFVRVKGHYGGEEDSFLVMVPEVSKSELVEMGKRHRQDSVIYSEAGSNHMIFTTGDKVGKEVSGAGFEYRPDAEDYYSEYCEPGDKEHTNCVRFSLRFDFDKLVPAIKAALAWITKGRFEESKHKRDHGRFSRTAGARGQTKRPAPKSATGDAKAPAKPAKPTNDSSSDDPHGQLSAKVTETIKGLLKVWSFEPGKHLQNESTPVKPEHINGGHCDIFANELLERFPRGRIAICERPLHAWFAIDGKHYDAEAPEGVSDPKQLPFFKRTPMEKWEGAPARLWQWSEHEYEYEMRLRDLAAKENAPQAEKAEKAVSFPWVTKQFQESKHPRDHGKFSRTQGARGRQARQQPKKPTRGRKAPGSQLPEAQRNRLRSLGMVGTFPPADVPVSDIKITEGTAKELRFKPLMQWNQKTKSGRISRQYRYTQEFHDRNAAEKFDRVMAVEPHLAKARSVLTKTMTNKAASNEEQDAAAIALIIMETGLRPTDGADSVKHGHFGIASLQNRHVKIKGNEVHLDFIGKEGVRNRAVIRDPKTVSFIKEVVNETQTNGPKHELWTVGSGPAGAALKQAIIKAGGPKDVKLKDLRTIRATQAAREVVSQFKGPPPPLTGDAKKDAKAITKAILAMCEPVAKILCNEPQMARENYIHPETWKPWLSRLQAKQGAAA